MIEVKRDPTVVLPTFSVPITSENVDENDKEMKERQQTKTDGILTPLIRINNNVIDGRQIVRLKLRMDSIPSLDIVMHDTFGIVSTFDNPDNDSTIQLQIIPSFDNTYKKINMTFYVERCSVHGYEVSLHCSYIIPKLYDNVMKAYGKISSYELFDEISEEYGLGFSSNLNGTADERYIYNANSSPIQLMNQEIKFSGLENNAEPHVFDWWIDQWNYLNFVDLYTEYKEVVPPEQMAIWAENRNKAVSSDDNEKPMVVEAMFTNHPSLMTHQQYISSYKNIINTSPVTDLNFEVYDMLNLSRLSTVIMDGDVKNNIKMKYTYGGELFGDYDYLTKRACRNIFRSKIESQIIEVTSDWPILSLARGHKVNIYWYDINKTLTADAQDKMNEHIESNIKLPNSLRFPDANIIINKTISGQYYIMHEEILFERGRWGHTFRLGRYADQVQKIS